MHVNDRTLGHGAIMCVTELVEPLGLQISFSTHPTVPGFASLYFHHKWELFSHLREIKESVAAKWCQEKLLSVHSCADHNRPIISTAAISLHS